MSALALIALRRGIPVTGSDTDISGAGDLVAAGARVFAGHAADQVGDARAVVASAAIAPGQAEVAAARARGIPVVPRKEAPKPEPSKELVRHVMVNPYVYE